MSRSEVRRIYWRQCRSQHCVKRRWVKWCTLNVAISVMHPCTQGIFVIFKAILLAHCSVSDLHLRWASSPGPSAHWCKLSWGQIRTQECPSLLFPRSFLVLAIASMIFGCWKRSQFFAMRVSVRPWFHWSSCSLKFRFKVGASYRNALWSKIAA